MAALQHISIALVAIIGYYHGFKKLLRKPAYAIATYLQLTETYSLQAAQGAVGFALVTLTHIVFVMVLCYCWDIDYWALGITQTTLPDLLLGSLLGIGIAATATLFCLLLLKSIVFLCDYSAHNIMQAMQGGWLKSYSYIQKVAPVPLALLLIIIGLMCEEIVFRSILTHYLFSLGRVAIIIITTLLFMLMQTFQTATLRGCLFPMVGALLMGLVHGYLYLTLHNIWPLILSHISFFMFFLIKPVRA